jgi:hypothetical protein
MERMDRLLTQFKTLTSMEEKELIEILCKHFVPCSDETLTPIISAMQEVAKLSHNNAIIKATEEAKSNLLYSESLNKVVNSILKLLKP